MELIVQLSELTILSQVSAAYAHATLRMRSILRVVK